jgi:hypothetical protein
LDISVSFPLCSLQKKIPVLHRPSWPHASWWPRESPLIINNIDVRTFVPFMVFAWHWKKFSALSLDLVHRTLPLQGLGWWPLGMAWL